MKKMISILIMGALPALASAAGDHTGRHGMSDHGMGGHKMTPEQTQQHQHESGDMSGMSHDQHEADAGRPGESGNVSRTIEVGMKDTMRFTPDQLKFRAGETVRFVVRNDGKIQHEMVIGSVDELKEHAAMMRTNPSMKHADSNMISLAPGEQGEIIWQFGNAGTFDFACLIPGHLEAGMTGKIEVN
jgi:uncharacterized cupredoxin-like copper-binding protein